MARLVEVHCGVPEGAVVVVVLAWDVVVVVVLAWDVVVVVVESELAFELHEAARTATGMRASRSNRRFMAQA
jgi:hypothetical protein